MIHDSIICASPAQVGVLSGRPTLAGVVRNYIGLRDWAPAFAGEARGPSA